MCVRCSDKYETGDDSYFKHALAMNNKLHASLAAEGEAREAARQARLASEVA